MNRTLIQIAIAAAVVLFVLWINPFYVVNETEQVIVTQFGRPVGTAVTNAGLHLRIPLAQEVHRIERRALEWDGEPREMPTRDKTYLVVDAFARWRISDPGAFFLRLRDERSARSRLDDIIGGEIRSVVAAHDLIEIVRSSRERQPVREEVKSDGIALQVHWPAIQSGRAALERLVQDASAPKLASFGIELLNVQFTRINYNRAVEQSIYQRMISERQQIAERFRSEGQGEAARILGNREKELQLIESEAYRKVQSVRGDADARASEIYAQAYNRDAQAAEFYAFMKTLETWQKAADANTTLLLGTDSDVFGMLKGMNGPATGK
ncbi:MAG: protease modulator HflC [Verrucomicrobiota bacterium]|jgi:membrane protease subunit HflC